MKITLQSYCNEFRKGNQKLFDALFSDYYVNLCRFALTFVRSTNIAEEIVQEIFISLWENREKLDINVSVRSFLYTSVKNRALNHIRNEKTRQSHEQEHAKLQFLKHSTIIDFCECEELQHIIIEAVNELPHQCRTIFEMSRNEALTYNEIATRMNISPKTVENQMGIALKKLRVKLMPYLSGVCSVLLV